jgi:hypothetical protein
MFLAKLAALFGTVVASAAFKGVIGVLEAARPFIPAAFLALALLFGLIHDDKADKFSLVVAVAATAVVAVQLARYFLATPPK